nr:rRNA cytosine-C5-methylase [Pseudomonadota bacterium]
LGPELTELLKIQAEILDSASRLVKPGGRLVYATCSLLREENEQQIEQFLAQHPDFAAVPVAVPGLEGQGPYLRLTPARHHTDGFFAAALERASAP